MTSLYFSEFDFSNGYCRHTDPRFKREIFEEEFPKGGPIPSWKRPEYLAAKGITPWWVLFQKRICFKKVMLKQGFKPVLGDLTGEIEEYLEKLLFFYEFKEDIYNKWNGDKITVEKFIELAIEDIIKHIPYKVLDLYKMYLNDRKKIPKKLDECRYFTNDKRSTAEYWDSFYRSFYINFLIDDLKKIGIDANIYILELIRLLDEGTHFDIFSSEIERQRYISKIVSIDYAGLEKDKRVKALIKVKLTDKK